MVSYVIHYIRGHIQTICAGKAQQFLSRHERNFSHRASERVTQTLSTFSTTSQDRWMDFR